MTKTIEEAAREFMYDSYVTSENFCREDISDAFECGAEYVMDLPLAQRLTAEEKERVRSYYRLARGGYWGCNCADKAVAKSLESIFGKDFFKEEE